MAASVIIQASRTIRSSWILWAPSTSNSATYAPLRGSTSTSPDVSNSRIASRTGFRDTPSFSAIRSSIIRSPATSSPLRIMSRIFSATMERNGE